MGVPFIHATDTLIPRDIQLERESRVILSEYKSFEHSLVSDVLSLKYVLEGVEEYTVNGKHHRVESGQFILVQPGDDVKVAWTSPDVVKGVCIYFDPAFTEEFLSEDHSTLLPSRKYIMDQRLHKWYKSYLKGASSADEAWWQAAGITNELLRQHHRFSNQLSGGRPSTSKALSAATVEAILFMNEHINEPFELEKLAHHACLSKFHFLRVFKQATGLTPQAYFQKIRYQRACELLDAGEVKVQEVAWELGFNEVGAFSKFFKKHSGESPSKWKGNYASMMF